MPRRTTILISLLLGQAGGVAAGILLAFLFSRDVPSTYAVSSLAYGLIGAVVAAGSATLLATFLRPARVILIAGGGVVAASAFLVLAYWGNKWLLSGIPFHRPVSLAFDGGALIVSLLLGAALSWPLSRRSGEGVGAMAAASLALLLLPLALLVVTVPSRRDSVSEDGDERLSVVLVSFDAQRADHLGCYGYSRETSPTVDRLASEGVLFETAFCPVPSTSPSHASMLSGTMPQSHGVRQNAYVLSPSVETLAEIFARAGYATGGFTTNVLLGSRFGFSQGFDTYVESGHVERVGSWNTGLLLQSLVLKEVIDKLMYRFREGPDPTVLAAEYWLGGVENRPFFLFFHLLDPHTPYDPPGRFRSLFPLEAGREENSLWFDSGKDAGHLARAISLYDGEVRAADAKLEELLRYVAKIGREKRLLVVFTADHGENLGDHRPFFGHQDLYDSVLHVPLVFWLPGVLPAGARVEGLADNRDIVPTILALAGLAVSDRVEGVDLGPRMRGSGGPGLGGFLAYHGRRYAYRTADRKLILDFRTGERRLYDLSSDPRETTNRAEELAEDADLLEERLRREAERVEKDDYLAGEETSRMDALDRETKERLRGLGYLD